MCIPSDLTNIYVHTNMFTEAWFLLVSMSEISVGHEVLHIYMFIHMYTYICIHI